MPRTTALSAPPDWNLIAQFLGESNTRLLRLMRRSATFSQSNEEFFQLMVTTVSRLASLNGAARSRAQDEMQCEVRRFQADMRRDERAASYHMARTNALRTSQFQQLSKTLLRLRRQALPHEFAARLRARNGTYKAFLEAHAALSHGPEPQAGAYMLQLTEQISHQAHERPGNTLRDVLAREPTTPPSTGECVICKGRKLRWPLSACSHSSMCRNCLHRHTMQQLGAGVLPSCPMCRTAFPTGEVLYLVAPYHRDSPAA